MNPTQVITHIDREPRTPCFGLVGRLFGHKYVARYEVNKQTSPNAREHLVRVVGRLTDTHVALAPGDRLRALEMLADALHSTEQFMNHEICVRCGNVVNFEMEGDPDEEEGADES